MLEVTKIFRTKHLGALIHATRLAFVVILGEGRFRCLMRSDWVIAQQVRHNRLDNRTSCNSLYHPIFTGPVHSSDMPHFTIDPCTGQSAGSARANRIV